MFRQQHQLWGEPEFKVPQNWGMRGGKIASDINQKTYVYTVALARGEQE